MRDPLKQIDQLRQRRVTPERDLTIGGLLANTARQAKRTHKQLGELVQLWEELVPKELADRTSLVSLRGGVLQVSVESSGVLFDLDRLLRNGLTQELRRRFAGSLASVRLRVTPLSQ